MVFISTTRNMGKSSLILILLAISAYKITGLYGDCKLTSPGCYGGELNSATVECMQRTDKFKAVVAQQNCLGYRGYHIVNGKEYYSFRPNFDISLKLSQFNFYSDQFFNLRYFEIYVKIITIDNGNFIAVPSGLYDFTNLTTIYINGNMLQEINLNKFMRMPSLMKIYASFNNIAVLEEETEVLITGSSIMTTIDLSHNMIDYVPDNYFVHFTKLRHLNMSFNSISNFGVLTFEGISQLETLDLSYNKLSQIGHTLVRFVNLKELSLAHNNLVAVTEPNFNTMTSLEKLNISCNKLSEIEDDAFNSLSPLTELDLSMNHLSVIHSPLFRNNTELRLLDLSQNSIHLIEPGAFENTNITSFFFDNNNLNGSIQQATFEGIHTSSLDLSGGMITSLEYEAFRNAHVHSLNLSSNLIHSLSKTSFNFINDLKALDLSNNNINAIDIETTNMKDLVVLKVRNNSMTKIVKSTFQNLTMLVTLDLSYNKISEVEPRSFENMEKLVTLELNNNVLSNFLERNTFRRLSSLTDLQLSFTRIPSFKNESFSDLNSLSILNSSHGELTCVEFNAFKNTGSIEILDLSYNLLDNFLINTSDLTMLEELYLNDNRIRNITNNTFFGLMHLITLNLNNNNIVMLGPTVFYSLLNMQNLYLSSNGDIEINGVVFDNLTSLTNVMLRNSKNKISFENVTSTTIKRLDLSSCHIKNANTIYIFNLHSLEVLNLSMNKIAFIDKFTFQSMPDLFWLDLSTNLISFIQPGSFLKTNNILSLNLHGNEIPNLQFGVLDGLNELQELNLSRNALQSIEISVLHKTPHISTIALDDNGIEELKFHEFSDTSIKVISIGGNPISCEVFVSLKKESVRKISITAETLDYHSENVDGIRCKSYSNSNKSVIWPHLNNTDINATFAFISLQNAIQTFADSIEKLGGKHEAHESGTAKNITEILESLDKLIANNNKYLDSINIKNITLILYSLDEHIVKNDNKTEMIANVLNKLSYVMDKYIIAVSSENHVLNSTNEQNPKHPVNNNSKLLDYHFHESFIRMFDEEKEKMFEELKAMFQKLKVGSNISVYEAQAQVRNEKADSNGIMYFIATCLFVIIVILVSKFVYKFISPRSRVLRSNSLHSSTQPIANVIEME